MEITELWGQFVALIENQIKTNEYFTGTALVASLIGAAGTILMFLKRIPIYIWSRVTRWLSFSATIEETDELYGFMEAWLKHYYPKSHRRVEAKYKEVYSFRSTSKNKGKLELNHLNDVLFIWKGINLVKITTMRETVEGAFSAREMYKNSYVISGILAKPIITKILRDVIEFNESLIEDAVNNKITIKTYGREGTVTAKHDVTVKGFKDLYLEEKDEIIKDIDTFIASKPLYNKMLIPHKRGYLFYGSPGNGKSSLGAAIAEHLKYTLRPIELGVQTSSTLKAIGNELKPNSVVLIEDIDGVFNGRKCSVDNLDFSVFLNFLSGVSQIDNVITVITTNHPEHLDPALLREGRCDFKIEIKNPPAHQVAKYICNFFQLDDFQLPDYKETKCFAFIQNACLTYRDSIDRAISKILE